MSKRGPLKSTRLFSLQLANHDQLFGRTLQLERRGIPWLKILICLPALLLFLIPSFKLGRAVLKKPELAVPDRLKTGELFTLQGEADLVPQIAGHTLSHIDAKTPLYLGVAMGAPDFEINFIFNEDDPRHKLKAMLPRLK